MSRGNIKYNHIKVGTLKIEKSVHRNDEYSRTTIYNRSGKVREIKNYKNDKLDGDFEAYWPNGKVHTRGEYKKGCRIGSWSFYNDKGNLIQEEKHDKNS
ncbi:MAG: hypothetical protein CMG64_04940 [Candidatus Marinimicrobia bacterium]|nr:hypothetical protein [Candidatus Neomarinimicrobiota bacterium]|tara:strand:+ start:245 stop:541 length:297 start_codon:yes stop_codon:yes gene_type:complete